MSFDYFYGQQSDLFTFYRVPKVLFTNERFWNISADAKMLYGILLDRMSLSAKNGWIDKNGRVYQEYFDYFSDQLSMDLLKKDYPYDSEMLDNILELIVETVCTKRPLIRIGAEERPAEIVRSRFMKLNAEHIRYVMDCFKENTTKIRNIRQYMLTTIYNAPTTIDTYYDALVRHDMSHGYLEGGFKKLKMKREEGE